MWLIENHNQPDWFRHSFIQLITSSKLKQIAELHEQSLYANEISTLT